MDEFDPKSVRQPTTPQVGALCAAIEDALARTFENDTADYHRYKAAAAYYPPMFTRRAATMDEVHGALTRWQQRSSALLGEAIRSLAERLSEIEEPTVASTPAQPVRSNKVFVVHGHDGEPKQAVARFLEQLGLESVILHEQANHGRTIIEKFEQSADVGFAVVLLTPDDVGKAKDAEGWSARARQNVVLELGYFIASLGRSRVCALKKGDVEVPSDFSGVVYEPYDDAGAWKQALARELQGAGYEIDWNKVMRR